MRIELQPHQVSLLRYVVAYMRARFDDRLKSMPPVAADCAMRRVDGQLADVEKLLGGDADGR